MSGDDRPSGAIDAALLCKCTPTKRGKAESLAKFLARVTHLNLNGKRLTHIVRPLQCGALLPLFSVLGGHFALLDASGELKGMPKPSCAVHV
jgi:hypothetical protein